MSKKECKYCGSTRNLEIEHIKAQSKGGAQTILAYKGCNRSKQAKSLLAWLRWIKKMINIGGGESEIFNIGKEEI